MCLLIGELLELNEGARCSDGVPWNASQGALEGILTSSSGSIRRAPHQRDRAMFSNDSQRGFSDGGLDVW